MKKCFRSVLCLLLVLTMVVSPVLAVDYGVPERTGIAGSDLPQIHITVTDEICTGAELTKEIGYVAATIEVVDPLNAEHHLLDAGSQIKVRGNSTAGGAKRPYNFKLSSKKDVLGMGKGKKWCLLANMFDKSLLRNKLVFDFARGLGMDYVSDCKMVDVWMDGKYVGCYLLCEPVEAKTNRVDIDIENGDYLFEREKDRYEEGAVYITTTRYGCRFVMADPEELTAEQYADVLAMMDQVETAIASDDYEVMSQYINLESFVNLYIIEEFFKDVDVDYSSIKFYFQNGILYAGPVWDFDLTSGNCSSNYPEYNNLGGSGNSYEGYYATTAFWFRYLLRNETFAQRVKERFLELQPQIINLYEDNALGINQIDKNLAECSVSFDANWEVWSENSQDSTLERIPDATFEENVEYLRSWLRQRNAWMLFAYENDVPFEKEIGLVDGIYTFANAKDTNFKLDIAQQSIANKANALVNETSYADSQKFVVMKSGDYYTIRNYNSKRYLSTASYNPGNGTNVMQWSDINSPTDQDLWSITPNSDGTYSIAPKRNKDLRMDVDANAMSNGSNVCLRTNNDTVSQKWVVKAQNMLTDGVYKLGVSLDNNYVLNVAGNSNESGGNVWIWERGNNSGDQWAIQSTEDGYYSLRAIHSNHYLNVAENGTTNGTNVLQWSDVSIPDNEKWTALPNADGTWSFVSKVNGLYLDVDGGITENGRNVQCWEGNGTAAQKWNLEAQKTVNDGVYQIAANTNASQLVSVADDSTDSGANVCVWENRNQESGKLVAEYVGDGAYTLRFVNSNYYLDVPYAKLAPGSSIWQCQPTTSDAQKWRIIPNGDGTYGFVSLCNNLYLNRCNAENENGTDIIVWTADRSNAQRWLLNPTTIGLDGVWTIAASGNDNYVLDIAQASKNEGGNLIIHQRNDADNQKFIVQSIDDEYYLIRSLNSGLLLNVDNGSAINGTNVHQWGNSDKAGYNEKWQIIPHADGSYSFVAVCNGLYLDLSNNALNNGTNVQIWNHDATAQAQKWMLSKRNPSVPEGEYFIRSAINRNYVVDIASDAEGAVDANGANVQLYTNLDADHQKFALSYAGDGYYTIRNVSSGKNLDVQNLDMRSGANVQQWESNNGGDSQLWAVLPNNDGTYTFVSKCGGNTLHVAGDIAADHANLQVYTGNAGTAQKWDLLNADHAHVYEIQSVTAPSCTADGYTTYYCAACGGGTRGNIVPALGHDFSVMPDVNDADHYLAPTCNEEGLAYHKCSRCDAYDEEGTILAATGHNMVAGTVHPATCTEDGYTEYHCANCDLTDMGDIVEATGHNMVAGTVHPATCTEDGYTEYHCTNCDLTDMGDIVEATGHNMVAGTVHPATCTEDGYTEYHCANCDLTDMGDFVDALGHDFSVLPSEDDADHYLAPTCVEEGLAYNKCSRCDAYAEEATVLPATGVHTYVDGVCTGCGEKENKEAYDAALTLKSVSVDLNSDISINFNGLASIFDQYEDVYVVYSAEGKEDVIVRDSFTSSSGSDLRYNYAYNGLTALDLELEVYATVYGTKDGVLYHGDTKSYSIYKYCNSRLNNATATAAQKTVCANLLNYGGAAQLFKGVPADQCVNAKMTEEQKAYASDMNSLVLEKKSVVSQGTQIRFASQSLDMDSRITMNFVLSLANYTGDRNSVTYEITYTDSDGVAQTRTYTTADLKDNGDDRYTLSFAELRSTEMRTLVTCTVYINGVKEASYTNSVENYCCTCVENANNPEQQKTLAKYLMLYGDSAAVAFAS